MPEQKVGPIKGSKRIRVTQTNEASTQSQEIGEITDSSDVNLSQESMDSRLPHDKSKLAMLLRQGQSLANRYGKEYSTALVYSLFTLISLFVAVALFGILHSTGFLKIAFPGAVESAEFAGAFAGFFVVLYFLVTSYNRAVLQRKLYITGHVFYSDGIPARHATVYIVGLDRQHETDASGWFQIEVNEQQSWVVKALYGDQLAEVTVDRKDVVRPISVILRTASE